MRHTRKPTNQNNHLFFRSVTRCDVCDRVFSRKDSLKRHHQVYANDFISKKKPCIDEATVPLMPLTVHDMNSQSQMSGAGQSQSQIPTTPISLPTLLSPDPLQMDESPSQPTLAP